MTGTAWLPACYSLLDTAAADGLFPACQRRGVAVLAAGVFNSGILADPRPGAAYDYAPAPPDLLDRAQRIRVVCARYGVPIGAAAIRFVLRHPAVTAVVVGARDATEVIEDVGHLTAGRARGIVRREGPTSRRPARQRALRLCFVY